MLESEMKDRKCYKHSAGQTALVFRVTRDYRFWKFKPKQSAGGTLV